jgi:hypothetical protein
MTFRHGRQTALLLDTLNASAYFNNADAARTMDTADVTTFGAQARSYIAGAEDGTFTADGFFDGAIGLVDDRLWALGNASIPYAVTYAPDGGLVIGRQARLFTLLQTEVNHSMPVTDAVKLKLDGQITAGADWGKILHPDTLLSSTVSTGAGVDWGAASTNGGELHIHVVLNSRSTTTAVKIQHSVDNTTFVDVTGGSQTVPIGSAIAGPTPFGSPTSYILYPPAGTLNRYLRAVITPTAGTGNITVVVAFARF